MVLLGRALGAANGREVILMTNAKQSKQADAAPAPKAEPKLCLCGCGAEVNRRFKPGHDGRLKGRLIREVKAARLLGDDATLGNAEQALAALGWAKFIPAE